MNTVNVKAVFTTSIGRKIVMALTGLFLCSFLIVHLIGNLQLLLPEAQAREQFNAYSAFMSSNPIIRTLEIVMFAGFLFHIIYGIGLIFKNQSARPVRYKIYKANETSRFYSRFMAYSGVVVLIFLLLHLAQFFAVHRFGLVEAGETMFDTVKNTLSNPAFGIFYLVCMFLLAFHLAHGFQSAFQSLGLQINKRLYHRLLVAGNIFAIVICGGFATIPIYYLIQKLF